MTLLPFAMLGAFSAEFSSLCKQASLIGAAVYAPLVVTVLLLGYVHPPLRQRISRLIPSLSFAGLLLIPCLRTYGFGLLDEILSYLMKVHYIPLPPVFHLSIWVYWMFSLCFGFAMILTRRLFHNEVYSKILASIGIVISLVAIAAYTELYLIYKICI